jgi:hypothetical protein
MAKRRNTRQEIVGVAEEIFYSWGSRDLFEREAPETALVTKGSSHQFIVQGFELRHTGGPL